MDKDHILAYRKAAYEQEKKSVSKHEELPHRNQNIGVDLGIKDLWITSDGKKYENPKIIKKYERKLAKLQRQVTHKEKGSGKYQKKKEIAICHDAGVKRSIHRIVVVKLHSK